MAESPLVGWTSTWDKAKVETMGVENLPLRCAVPMATCLKQGSSHSVKAALPPGIGTPLEGRSSIGITRASQRAKRDCQDRYYSDDDGHETSCLLSQSDVLSRLRLHRKRSPERSLSSSSMNCGTPVDTRVHSL